MTKTNTLIVAAFATAALASTPVQGGETSDTYPRIEVEATIEIENDNTIKSDDKTMKINDFYNTTEIAANILFSKNVSLVSLFEFEPVKDPRPFKDRYVGDHGAYMEELYIQYQTDRLRVFVGKFDASFGKAWDDAPGIFGTDLAGDYELVERLGGGFAYKFGDEVSGEHTFQANLFFADTSFLSNSIFTKRGRTRRSSGGPSNTGAPESFSITLDGENFPDMPGFSYNIGFRHQAKGRGDVSAENGFVLGVQKEFDLGEGQAFKLLLEGAYLNNADTGPDNAFYGTVGGQFITGPWNAALSYTLRHMSVAGGTNLNDDLFQASAGYEFQEGVLEGITFDVGYKFTEEAKVKSHTIGVLMTKTFSFNTSN